MKKNILKIFALIFCVSLLMVGCATVSNVKINGKDAYYKDLQYNKGQVLVVGDYLYFGNGYTASSGEGFDYNGATKTGYMSRLNLSLDLTFDEKVSDVLKPYSTPKQIEKVNDKKLVGFQKQDMYALGGYIYFASANTHKTSDMKNDYTQVSLFRMKYNGDGLKELVKNSAFKQGEGSAITIQKGSDNNYYYIIVEPADGNTFTIKTIKIGDKIGKLKTIAKDVKSYAIADENSVQKNIIYTVSSEQAQETTAVKSVDFASGEVTDLDNGNAGKTVNFVGRAGDVVFYAYQQPNSETEVYYKDLASSDSYFNAPLSERFYTSSSISDVQKAGDGYIFKTSEGALIFKQLSSKNQRLMDSSDFTDILFVENDYVYTSSSKTIKRISTIDQNIETILTLSEKEIISGQCGYDGEFIYYFSQIADVEDIENPENNENEQEKETDENYYMFRVDKNGNSQLIGKSK